MLKHILFTLAAIGLLGSLGGLAGLAVFTDQATIGANAFDTGSVTISTTPTTALVTFTGMAPGDSVQPSAGVVVSNDGTLELRYAISSTTTEDVLAAALDLTIKTIDVTTPGSRATTLTGSARSIARPTWAAWPASTWSATRRRASRAASACWPPASPRRSASGWSCLSRRRGRKAPAPRPPSPSTPSRRSTTSNETAKAAAEAPSALSPGRRRFGKGFASSPTPRWARSSACSRSWQYPPCPSSSATTPTSSTAAAWGRA